MNLALKDIRHNRGRFFLTAFGIGMLLMIVMGMSGIYRGLIEDATLLIDALGADLWVAQRDTRGPFAELSRVPADLAYRVAAVPGVAQARAFVYHTIQREHEGRALRIAVLGLDWPGDQGAWLPLVAGRPLGQAHYEIIADRMLGLRIGERLTLGKDVYSVVGLTKGMIASGGDGLAFMTSADAQAVQFDLAGEAMRLERAARRTRAADADIGRTRPALLDIAAGPSAAIPALGPAMISAVVADVQPGARIEDITALMAGWPDITVYSRDEQKQLMIRGPIEMSRRQIGLFTTLLTVISAIVMALILYTLTLEKIHDIALLKLIGARNRVILGMILQQALLLGGLGYAIAYGIGQKLFPLFPRRVILLGQDLAMLAGIVLLISVLASLLAIWKALRVDPNEVLAA
jgi:putative ABC transport system permease protein